MDVFMGRQGDSFGNQKRLVSIYIVRFVKMCLRILSVYIVGTIFLLYL